MSSSSKNGTLKRNKPNSPTSLVPPPVSPTSSIGDSQLDYLLKSLAKETLNGINKDDPKNDASTNINKSEGEGKMR